MHLTPEMLMSGNIFPKEPMSKGGLTRLFFEATKNGETEIVKELLKKDKYLVYEYNNVG